MSSVSNVSIAVSSIPSYLRNGEFYLNLINGGSQSESGVDHHDDGKYSTNSCPADSQALISIPQDCLKLDEKILTSTDLYDMLRSLRFWMVDTLPDTVIAYAVETCHPLVNTEKKSFRDTINGMDPQLMIDLPKLNEVSAIASMKGRNERIVAALEQEMCEEIISFLLHNHDDEPLKLEVAIEAARCGSLQVLQFYHEKEPGTTCWDTEVCGSAVQSEQLACLQYVIEQGCPWIRGVCTLAAGEGSLNCLKYAHQQGQPWDKKACFSAAAMGHLSCLKFLHEHGCPWDSLICQIAADEGQLACLQYAHKHGCEWDFFTCSSAARNNRTDCLRYALQHNCPYNPSMTGMQAIVGGHVASLAVVIECGASLWMGSCRFAAEHGQLDCLKYAHEHGCHWDEEVCLAAAKKGHAHCLEYAHTQGCPWNSQTMLLAVQQGHVNCVQYAHEQGLPWDEHSSAIAAAEGHLEVLQYMHEHGCAWDATTCKKAAEKGKLDVLKYAHAQGCPWDSDTVVCAARNGNLSCLKYALEHGCVYHKYAYTWAKARTTELDAEGCGPTCYSYLKREYGYSTDDD